MGWTYGLDNYFLLLLLLNWAEKNISHLSHELINKIYINIWTNISIQLYINIWTNIHWYWLLYRIWGRANYLKKLLIIYYILNILLGRVGSDLTGLKFYYLNPIWPIIKNNFVTQSNPSSPKNQPNSTNWIELGYF